MGGQEVSVLNELNELAIDVCQNRCKYPEKYDCQEIYEDFENLEKMYKEQCKNCPIMELLD